jgi:hypothetical protein
MDHTSGSRDPPGTVLPTAFQIDIRRRNDRNRPGAYIVAEALVPSEQRSRLQERRSRSVQAGCRRRRFIQPIVRTAPRTRPSHARTFAFQQPVTGGQTDMKDYCLVAPAMMARARRLSRAALPTKNRRTRAPPARERHGTPRWAGKISSALPGPPAGGHCSSERTRRPCGWQV